MKNLRNKLALSPRRKRQRSLTFSFENSMLLQTPRQNVYGWKKLSVGMTRMLQESFRLSRAMR